MTRTAKTTAAAFECPKCDGKGHIRAFAHIVSGTCFLCGGVGLVDALPASDVEVYAEAVAAIDDGNQRRTVQIPNLGACTMTRYPDGDIRVDLDGFGWRDGRGAGRQVGGLWIVITTHGGEVRTARDEDGDRLGCDGILGGTGELERHVLANLSQALRR